MSNHEEVRELLSAAALGELDEAQRRQVDEHLETCEACREELGRMQEVLVLAGQIRQADLEGDVYRQARESVLGMVADLEARQRRRYGWIRYAAAAVLILGAWVLLQYFMGEQTVPEPPRAGSDRSVRPGLPNGTTPSGAEEARQIQLASELRLARQRFEARDIRGLSALYRAGEPETREAVIGYLEQIGSDEALQTLARLQAESENSTEMPGEPPAEEPPAQEPPQGVMPVPSETADLLEK